MTTHHQTYSQALVEYLLNKLRLEKRLKHHTFRYDPVSGSIVSTISLEFIQVLIDKYNKLHPETQLIIQSDGKICLGTSVPNIEYDMVAKISAEVKSNKVVQPEYARNEPNAWTLLIDEKKYIQLPLSFNWMVLISKARPGWLASKFMGKGQKDKLKVKVTFTATHNFPKLGLFTDMLIAQIPQSSIIETDEICCLETDLNAFLLACELPQAPHQSQGGSIYM